MSGPQAGSPNWYWLQLGCSVERVPKTNGFGNHRTIRRSDGTVVDTGDGSHEAELQAAQIEIERHRET